MDDRKKQIEEMAKDLQETDDYEGCEAWHCGGCQYDKYSKNYFCSCIKQAEKMTAKGYHKQREGKWKILKMGDGEKVRTCSACHISQTVNVYKGKVMFMFCPYCGAKMEGEK